MSTTSAPIDNFALTIMGINIIVFVLLLPFQFVQIDQNAKNVLSNSNINTSIPNLTRLSWTDILGSLLLIGDFINYIFNLAISTLTYISTSFIIVITIYSYIPYHLGDIWVIFSTIITSLFIFRHVKDIAEIISNFIGAIRG